MTVRVYRSTDTNAPTCSGEAGKFIGILDACLVNGYAMPSITSITRSGTTATVVFASAHGLVSFGNRLLFSGATQGDYNIEAEVTVVNTTTVTYQVANSPATPATGTPAATKPGSAWTKPFSGTNTAAYLQGSGSNGRYLRVDDTGTNDARIVGYESMSDVDTGTGPFPTGAQLTGGAFLRKSSAASSAVRDWILVATQKAFYFWVNQSTTLTAAQLNFFGDFPSYYSGADAYNTALMANSSAGALNGTTNIVTSIATAALGNWIARARTQTGGAVTMGKSIDCASSQGTLTVGANGEAYPSSITGGLLLSKIYIHEVAVGKRGVMDGIMAPLHNRPLTHLDTFSGAGADAGRKYLALTHSASGQSFLEISNTW